MDSNTANSNSLSENKKVNIEYYIGKVREFNEKKNTKPLALCITFGCQMNAHDSEKIMGMLNEMGFGTSDNEKSADLIIYNTCCVRENAENKVFGNLGYLKTIKEAKKDLKIVVCGCMTQQDVAIEKIRKSYRNVDVIFGTYNLHRLPELLWSSYETGEMIIDVWKEQEHGEIIEDLPMERELPFKASVNVMYGCNNFCSYCIVPFVRGRERSRKTSDIRDEIKKLASEGVKEVLLLGQNVNSYGNTFAVDSDNTDFTGLLEVVSNIEGIERIRFMTSHPKDLSDRLIYAMRDLPKVCKHLHLPFQSGSNRILEKMNRKYTKEHYISLIDKIKKEIPSIALSTDIIVGFPGETEEDFQDTIDIVNYVGFAAAYTFYYSIRTGTPAAKMDEQIPAQVAKERFDRLLSVLNPMVYEINKSYEGKVFSVLAESRTNEGILTGRADNNSLVHFKGGERLTGEIVDVKITEGKPFYLMGELC